MENNYLAQVNNETGEITEVNFTTSNKVVRETEDYAIVQLENGKFEKRVKYKAFSTYQPETEEDKIQLYKVFNEENNELVTPMRNIIGKQIVVKDIITRPYESFDENTGEITFGVLTTLIDENGEFIVTSSKSVYFSLMNMYKVFDLPLIVEVVGTKQPNGIQIGLSLVGK